MKIAVLGYGKMGKVIEQIKKERGNEIVLRKDQDISFDGLQLADVAIDFSVPNSAAVNITACLNNGIPVISGTTGWLVNYQKMVDLCEAKQGGFIYASNFSLGVNVFFELNEYLAKMMSNLKQYNVSIEEIHHTQKLDAPSGTAITLADGIIKNSDYTNWTLETPISKEIHIEAKRIENIPGTHSVFYNSNVDQIDIKHNDHII